VELVEFVRDFAVALKGVDARGPVFTSRTGRVYRPGIGPHSEDRAVDLIVAEMTSMHSQKYGRLGCRMPYSGSRQTCDIVLPDEWMIEVKMARFYGDNNKPDDTSLKDILSPFGVDRSAVTDCEKLARSGSPERKAIVIYGFDAPGRPLAMAIDAFETLAAMSATLGPRITSSYSGLVHPVHRQGSVFGWEVSVRLPGSEAHAHPK
jgi:hypothetical protein